jgi:hypothetical protein
MSVAQRSGGRGREREVRGEASGARDDGERTKSERLV